MTMNACKDIEHYNPVKNIIVGPESAHKTNIKGIGLCVYFLQFTQFDESQLTCITCSQDTLQSINLAVCFKNKEYKV